MRSLHSAAFALNRISVLSGTHLGLYAYRVTGVRRRGSPVAVRSFRNGSRASSPANGAASRRKTSHLPSGEIAGSQSANTESGGFVSCRFSPDSSDTTNRASGFALSTESVTTTQLESGHHATVRARRNPRGWISVSLRSDPVSGGTSRSSCGRPSPSPRRKAIQRPSGDHMGL
jgi:hypothetical protein